MCGSVWRCTEVCRRVRKGAQRCAEVHGGARRCAEGCTRWCASHEGPGRQKSGSRRARMGAQKVEIWESGVGGTKKVPPPSDNWCHYGWVVVKNPSGQG